MDFLTRGYAQDPAQVLRDALFDVDYDQMVIVRDVEFYSLCEHHMLPFFGKAHIAYIPNGKVIGLSKMARLVDIFARRLQVQERLTREIADAIEDAIHPQGVGVVIEAQHLCMMMRGVEKQSSTTVTSAMTGVFRSSRERAMSSCRWCATATADADRLAHTIRDAHTIKAVNGLLVLDKPAGMTSHDVVRVVRRATGEKSIGHLGTLDPMATGVLPLLLGKCTRLAQFFGQAEKSYTGTIRFGFATDTYDADGEQVGETRPLDKSLDELRVLAERFSGVIEQTPPAYSAKKINGVPAYKLARAGKPVPVKPVQIEILNFELLSLDGDIAEFAMRVSAGGYVRSVAHELGELAGCGAHLASSAADAGGRLLARERHHDG